MRNALVVALVLLMTGCQSHYYHQRLPVLERPERPVLANVPGSEMQKMSEEARTAVADNFGSLIDYSRKLETAIDTYNAYAREKNEELGLGD